MAYDIETLPELSRKVLVRLHDYLHVHEGEAWSPETRYNCFSAIEGMDLAHDLGVSAQAIGGAVSHLTGEGLAWVEDTDVNGRPYHFLHLTEEGFLAVGCPPEGE